jgi:hypothetical protein
LADRWFERRTVDGFGRARLHELCRAYLDSRG